MSIIVITDEAALAALSTAEGAQELRGFDGRVLGPFMPAPRPGMRFHEIGLTDEELLGRLHDPNAKWYTRDEVMARLRKLV